MLSNGQEFVEITPQGDLYLDPPVWNLRRTLKITSEEVCPREKQKVSRQITHGVSSKQNCCNTRATPSNKHDVSTHVERCLKLDVRTELRNHSKQLLLKFQQITLNLFVHTIFPWKREYTISSQNAVTYFRIYHDIP